MMYLEQSNILTIAKKQYFYKIRSYRGLFFHLMFVQTIAVLLSLYGSMTIGHGTSQMSVTVKYFSADLIIFLTLIWAFVTSIKLTTKDYRYNDYTFVTNRMTSNLSTILFIITTSFIGSAMAIFSGIFLRLITLLFREDTYISGQNFLYTFEELVTVLFVTALYIFLISAIGFFIGMLVQLNKAFVILVPVLFIGFFIFEGRTVGRIRAFEFFVHETSLAIFTLKVAATTLPILSSVFLFSNRLEVRK